MYARDAGISHTTIRRLLHLESPFLTKDNMTLNMYQYNRLSYFSGYTNVLGNNINPDDYIKQKPFWHKLNLMPRTFVFGKRPWSNGIQLIQVNPGNIDDNHKIAWWYTYDSATKQNLSGIAYSGLRHTRSLIGDFGNDKTDVFFMANLVGPIDDGYQDAGKDAVVVRFNPVDSQTNLQVYVASHEVKILNSNTHEVKEKLAFYSKALDVNLPYSQDKLSAYMADLNADGHEDLIIRVDENNQSTWLGFLAKYNNNGQLTFSNQIELANNIPTENTTFFAKDVTGDNRADLVYGKFVTDSTVTWYVRGNSGDLNTVSFGTETEWKEDFGNKGDLFYMADFNGDGKNDLFAGRYVNEDTISWYASLSDGSSFGTAQLLINDFGNYGDNFYFTDYNGDGKDDLVILRNSKKYTGGDRLKIFIRTSNGSDYNGSFYQFSAPDYSDLVMAGDFTGDGKDDIAVGRPLGLTKITWYLLSNQFNGNNYSNGFADPVMWISDFGDPRDKVWVADLNGDNKKDLLLKRIKTSTVISWFGVYSNGNAFVNPHQLAYDFGNDSVNDNWYVGDFNGDGKDDLALARKVATDHVRWMVELSDGNYLKPWTIWKEDFGNDFSFDKYFIGDFNGDNKDDLALARLSKTDNTLVTWFETSSIGNKFGAVAKWRNDFGNKGDTWLVGDFYNHGKSDILLFRKMQNKTDLYLMPSWGNKFGDWIDPGYLSNHFYTGKKILDFNNDGLPDILIIDNNPYAGKLNISVNRHSF